MLHNLLTSLYEYEITVNRNVQNQFEFAEAILRNINDYLDPIYILNLWIPLVGALEHKLLVQLASSVGLMNALTSVIKWCFAEYRPAWWLKETTSSYKYNFRDIKIYPYSCDTSAGLPSTHAAAFTTFALILCWRSFGFPLRHNNYMLIYATLSLLCGLVWFIRLYFLYEFLHQCLLGSLLAVVLINVLKCFFKPLVNLGKLIALLMLIGFGSIPIGAYFAMLYMDIDPFWSVRMAFKWCGDPLHLKHETSPVFILCRDFGYLMGVALSCPLAKNYDNTTNNYRKRLPILLIVEIINALLRSYTPRQYGRFIFVAYEFLRNCLHSLTLLTVLPKLDIK